jgi:hypothetical protein
MDYPKFARWSESILPRQGFKSFECDVLDLLLLVRRSGKARIQVAITVKSIGSGVSDLWDKFFVFY